MKTYAKLRQKRTNNAKDQKERIQLFAINTINKMINNMINFLNKSLKWIKTMISIHNLIIKILISKPMKKQKKKNTR